MKIFTEILNLSLTSPLYRFLSFQFTFSLMQFNLCSILRNITHAVLRCPQDNNVYTTAIPIIYNIQSYKRSNQLYQNFNHRNAASGFRRDSEDCSLITRCYANVVRWIRPPAISDETISLPVQFRNPIPAVTNESPGPKEVPVVVVVVTGDGDGNDGGGDDGDGGSSFDETILPARGDVLRMQCE